MIKDTTPKNVAHQLERFRRMTGEERLMVAMNLSDEIRDIALAGFKSRHPQVPEKELLTLFFSEIHQIEIKQK